MQWYYLVQGQRQGPVGDSDLEALVRQGTVRDDTYVWREGLAEWQLFGVVKPKPAPAASPAPAATMPSDATGLFSAKPETTPYSSPAVTPKVESSPASSGGYGAPQSSSPVTPQSTTPYKPTPAYQPSPSPSYQQPSPQPTPQPSPQPSPSYSQPAAQQPSPSYQSPAAQQSSPQQPASARPYVAPVSTPAPAPMTTSGSSGAFFFYPVLEALNDGRFIRKCVIIALKVLAVLVALGGLLMALTVITASSHGSGGALLGAILFAIVLLGTAACVGQIYWYRSGSVASLAHSRNTVIPIFAILSRAGGEAAATGLGGLGVGACLFMWLSSGESLGLLAGIPYMGMIPSEGGFLTGIIVLVYLSVLGFGSLILGYLWAECIMLLVDIEQNTRKSG